MYEGYDIPHTCYCGNRVIVNSETGKWYCYDCAHTFKLTKKELKILKLDEYDKLIE